jgi:hypothetical protein
MLMHKLTDAISTIIVHSELFEFRFAFLDLFYFSDTLTADTALRVKRLLRSLLADRAFEPTHEPNRAG